MSKVVPTVELSFLPSAGVLVSPVQVRLDSGLVIGEWMSCDYRATVWEETLALENRRARFRDLVTASLALFTLYAKRAEMRQLPEISAVIGNSSKIKTADFLYPK